MAHSGGSVANRTEEPRSRQTVQEEPLDALGRPLAFILTGGEAADCKAYDALISLPERSPGALLADKGYDAETIRADLAERKIETVIPGTSNRRVKIEHDRALYRQRNRIERIFGHLKVNRAIATRYDQLANSFLGMVYLATARYWLKFVHAA
ncbi:IS5 family transposase [Rhizobium sp. SG570]|uniref:IS5 family transposase n=1 Tax=Rhizobium sp. SG570 TaxID=2587113 RepID=UPI001FEEA3C3|nr:IS5 family transposase [Rhizobium sp. SG570]